MQPPLCQDGQGEPRGWNDVVRDIRDICLTRRILLVYSKHDVSYYNYRHMLSRHLAEGPALRVAVIGGTNHTFSPHDAAERLAAVTVEWMLDLIDAEVAPLPTCAGGGPA
jgi:hypothetical protein